MCLDGLNGYTNMNDLQANERHSSIGIAISSLVLNTRGSTHDQLTSDFKTRHKRNTTEYHMFRPLITKITTGLFILWAAL